MQTRVGFGTGGSVAACANTAAGDLSRRAALLCLGANWLAGGQITARTAERARQPLCSAGPILTTFLPDLVPASDRCQSRPAAIPLYLLPGSDHAKPPADRIASLKWCLEHCFSNLGLVGFDWETDGRPAIVGARWGIAVHDETRRDETLGDTIRRLDWTSAAMTARPDGGWHGSLACLTAGTNDTSARLALYHAAHLADLTGTAWRAARQILLARIAPGRRSAVSLIALA